MTPDPDDGLFRAALRMTADDPRYAGYWLARHRTTEGLTDAQLAAKLGTDVRGLALAALCRTPRPDSFAEDVGVIAARAGVGPAPLAGLFRQEQSLAAWSSAPTSPSAATGWLLAAHDADPPPPGGDRDDPAPS